MNVQLSRMIAQEHMTDLQRAADRSRMTGRAERRPRRETAVPVVRPAQTAGSLTIRLASPVDESRLVRLAALDSARLPASPVLLAEVDGQLRAALALSDGAVVADPFQASADLVAVLRTRACQLGGTCRNARYERAWAWARVRVPAWR